eukprot:scaffold60963_cov45-Phaeocystis_antarctica.AAC.1
MACQLVYTHRGMPVRAARVERRGAFFGRKLGSFIGSFIRLRGAPVGLCVTWCNAIMQCMV